MHAILALVFVVLTVGFVMTGFYLDAERALEGIANTVYPGRRSLPGGTYQLAMLGSHFFPFWMEDGRIPRFFSQYLRELRIHLAGSDHAVLHEPDKTRRARQAECVLDSGDVRRASLHLVDSCRCLKLSVRRCS